MYLLGQRMINSIITTESTGIVYMRRMIWCDIGEKKRTKQDNELLYIRAGMKDETRKAREF